MQLLASFAPPLCLNVHSSLLLFNPCHVVLGRRIGRAPQSWAGSVRGCPKARSRCCCEPSSWASARSSRPAVPFLEVANREAHELAPAEGTADDPWPSAATARARRRLAVLHRAAVGLAGGRGHRLAGHGLVQGRLHLLPRGGH